MTIESFLDHHNGLILEDEPTAFYQIVHSATDEVWETLPSPAKPDEVNAAISNIALTLPTGNHTLKLQALAGGQVRGQTMLAVVGKSASARKGQEDAMSLARATAMNVQTAEQQLSTMGVRLEQAEERARQAEERAGGLVLDTFKAADMVHSLMMKQEEERLDRADREARNAAMLEVAKGFAPILGQVLVVASKFMEYKMASWENGWKAEAEAAAAKADEEKKAE